MRQQRFNHACLYKGNNMFSIFDFLRPTRYGVSGRVFSRILRVMFGLIFVYVGVNLTADLVRGNAKDNEKLRAMVYKYDAADAVGSVVGSVGNAISDSFTQNGQPTSLKDANQQAKSISKNLEGGFREQIPMLHQITEEAFKAAISPIQEALRNPKFQTK
jgi:hypothetical protein